MQYVRPNNCKITHVQGYYGLTHLLNGVYLPYMHNHHQDLVAGGWFHFADQHKTNI